MRRTVRRWGLRVVPVVALLAWATMPTTGQSGAKNGEWTTYGADLRNTRYSPLDQITADNFNKLEVAWRFKTESLGPRPEYQLESTPLMAHWSNGRDERILYVTPGYRLIALDAKTGIPVASFGKDGVVDLKLDDDQNMDLVTGEVGLHSTPLVAGNTVIVGAAHLSGGVPRGKANEKGYVRGFDIRTAKRLWIFPTIPRPGEFGNDTWEKDSWSYTGNTGVWGQISVDDELGIPYLPAQLPPGDTYAGPPPPTHPFP